MHLREAAGMESQCGVPSQSSKAGLNASGPSTLVHGILPTTVGRAGQGPGWCHGQVKRWVSYSRTSLAATILMTGADEHCSSCSMLLSFNLNVLSRSGNEQH